MRHGLIVQIANKTCAEAAILESSLAYKAKRIGEDDGERTSFSVFAKELEDMYPYFEKSIDEYIAMLCEISVGGDPMYASMSADLDGDIIYKISVDNRWMRVRSAL